MKREVLVKFGRKVREERARLGLSQEELAGRAHVHRTYVGMIERAEKNIYSDETISIQNNFIRFGNKTIVIVDSLPWIKSVLNNKLKADYIILSKNPKIKISSLKNLFEFKKVIIDSSNKQWKNDKWKKECEELKIDFYSVIDSGAYAEELL